MKKFWILSAGLVAVSGFGFADTIWTGSSNGGGSYGSCAGCTTMVVTSVYTGSQVTYAAGTPANVSNGQTPFWNNPSGDNINNHVANVGDILGGLATGTNLIGSNLSGAPGSSSTVLGSYYSNTITGGANGNGDPTTTTTTTGTINSTGVTEATPALEYSFMSSQTAYTVSLLFADSGEDTGCTANCGTGNNIGTTFGVYTEPTAGTIVFSPISSPTNNTTGTAQTIATNDVLDSVTNGVYGFYATVCYSTNAAGTACTYSVTYTTGAGNWSTNASGNPYLGGLGWNHFALFELANGEEVLGFEDSPWIPASNDPNSSEGIGDFNDIVIGLTAPVSAPEPGTIAIMGFGLAGLGLIGRRRFAKK